jgi:hypothetical protein
MYDFGIGASASSVTSSGTVTIYFNIPADAWQAGQNKMTVNVALERLQPADKKLSGGSNGNYVYNVQKNGENSYSFTVKPTTTTEGPCKVTLTADYFKNENNSVTITQTVPHALKMTNNKSVDPAYRAQVYYTLDERLEKNTTYTFTCWVKSSQTKSLGIYIQNTDGQQQSLWDLTLNNIGTNWTECRVQFTTDNGTNNRYNLITFNIGTNAVGESGAVYMDKVSLTKNGDSKNLMEKNSDMNDFTLVNGQEVPVGWDKKFNNDNNSNPSCSVIRVEGGYE